MHITIAPFQETHLEEARNFLAFRHQENRTAEQALPIQFIEPHTHKKWSL
jgi:hypothetical protein